MKSIKWLLVLLVFCLPTVVFGAGSKDEAYPSRNITVFIPRGAGGPTDIPHRNALEFLKPKMPPGINFVVVNRPEGTGIPALVEGAHARPDGYTLTAYIVDAIIYHHLGLMKESVYDYRGIAAIHYEPLILVVNKNSPFNNLREFVDYAKQHPGEVTLGTVGAGSTLQWPLLDLERQLNLKFMQVPYNDGAAAVNVAIMGGHIVGAFNFLSNSLSQILSGDLKPLGFTDTNRSPLVPNVPTFKESLGIDLNFAAWNGVCVPKDTPDSVVNWLVDKYRTVMTTREFKEQCQKMGIPSPEIFGSDFDKFRYEQHEALKNLVQLMQ